MVFKFFPERPSGEQRKLAEFPGINKQIFYHPSSFLQQFDLFFTDHFGFRSTAIFSYNYFHSVILRISPRDDIVIGKDGWYFYNSKNDGINIDDYCGYHPFTDSELSIIKQRLLQVKNDGLKNGYQFYLLIAPNKHTIYPEELPLGYSCKIGTSRFDQLVVLTKDLEINLIDVRNVLIENKSNLPVYYQLDTHWNDFGAYLASEELLKKISQDNYSLPVNTIPDFKLKRVISYHDTAKFISIEGHVYENEVLMERPVNNSMSVLDFFPPYSSSPGRVTIGKTVADNKLPKMLMYRDSFGIAMIPFLENNFSRSVYIWNNQLNLQVVAEEHPNILVYEIVERNLSWLQAEVGE
ncbi:MAG: hypothetical protein WCJ58_06900 [bacterium]